MIRSDKKMRIGILYNLVDEIEKGVETEKLSDNEIYPAVVMIRDILSKRGHKARLIRVNPKGINEVRKQLKSLRPELDFIFNQAEGVGGNLLAESKVAGIMEELKIPFSGADSRAISLCINKAKAKRLFLENNILTPDFQVFKSVKEKRRKNLGFPLIVKPAHEGGSVGITADSVVHDDIRLNAKVREVLELYRQPALVEEFIDGREINIALIGNLGINLSEKKHNMKENGLRVLPLSEISFNFPGSMPRIVSFDAKWSQNSFEYKNTPGICPADVSESLKKSLMSKAKKAFEITGCKDYARVDFRIRKDELYVLEVNYNPCISTDSGFFRSANAAGYSYEKMICMIFKTALERYALAEF